MADRLIFVHRPPGPVALLCARLARPAAWICVLTLAARLVLAEEVAMIYDPAAESPARETAAAVAPDGLLRESLERGRQAYAAGDFGVARHWLWIAAEQDNAESQYLIGLIYRDGLGGDGNPGVAAEWLHKAAMHGHAPAQAAMAALFRDGIGVENDDAEAVWWFRQAASQGLPEGQAGLGEMILLGRGVRQDDSDAARWLLRAAEQGHATAQYQLARCFAEGRGVVRDRVVARRWLEQSAARGHAPAREFLGDIDRSDSAPGMATSDVVASSEGK